MKTVYHVITTINRGGAENQLLVLVNEQVKAGLDVHVVFLKGEPELLESLLKIGVKVHSELVGVRPALQSIHLGRLIRDRAEIVHAHLPRAELVSFFTFGRFKFFVSRHNAESFFPSQPGFVSAFLSRMVALRARKIISISDSVKVFLLTSKEIKNPNSIQVVHYGYVRGVNALVPAHRILNGNVHIGTISRLVEQKDLPTMILSFAEYHSEFPQSKLSIVGSGPLRNELQKLIDDLGLRNSVLLRGRTDNVFGFLNELDIFMLTSVYEGFGMVLLEAMDAQVPIIASNTSAIPEVLGTDFPNLCEPGNVREFSTKMRLLNNVGYRRDILLYQNQRLDSFNAFEMAKKITQIYLDGH